MCERETRGAMIAAVCKVENKGKVWTVPSQSGEGKYTVCPDEQSPFCSCPDHETRGCICKHIFAVRFVMQRELFPDGSETVTKSVTITETVSRKTYPQKWTEYNAAQVNEKRHFQELLRDLCQGIAEPVQTGKGRPSLPLCDAIFSAVFKVYSTVSGRRFMTDLNGCPRDWIYQQGAVLQQHFQLSRKPSVDADSDGLDHQGQLATAGSGIGLRS